VEAVVFRALAKDKNSRFQSMRALHEALLSIPPDASASMSGTSSPTKLRPAVRGPFAASGADTGPRLRTTASYSASDLDSSAALPNDPNDPNASNASNDPAPARSTRERVLLGLAAVGSVSLVLAAIAGLIWALSSP